LGDVAPAFAECLLQPPAAYADDSTIHNKGIPGSGTNIARISRATSTNPARPQEQTPRPKRKTRCTTRAARWRTRPRISRATVTDRPKEMACSISQKAEDATHAVDGGIQSLSRTVREKLPHSGRRLRLGGVHAGQWPGERRPLPQGRKTWAGKPVPNCEWARLETRCRLLVRNSLQTRLDTQGRPPWPRPFAGNVCLVGTPEPEPQGAPFAPAPEMRPQAAKKLDPED
jgi:hypothetical protein